MLKSTKGCGDRQPFLCSSVDCTLNSGGDDFDGGVVDGSVEGGESGFFSGAEDAIFEGGVIFDRFDRFHGD